jgi:hypothetical protein
MMAKFLDGIRFFSFEQYQTPNTRKRRKTMAAEIVFDDGGSTRVKQLGFNLDDVLNVDPVAVGSGPVPTAPGSKVKAFGDFDQLRVITINNDGVSTQSDRLLAAGDAFQLVSNGQQRIHGRIVAAAGGVGAHCC